MRNATDFFSGSTTLEDWFEIVFITVALVIFSTGFTIFALTTDSFFEYVLLITVFPCMVDL